MEALYHVAPMDHVGILQNGTVVCDYFDEDPKHINKEDGSFM